MHLRDGKSTLPSDSTLNGRTTNIDTMPYTNCETRIIDLSPLKLPKDPKTPDSTLCQIYRDYVDKYGSHSSSKRRNTQRPRGPSSTQKDTPSLESTKTQHAESLVAAILSLKTGIAPPVAFPTETVYGLGADATNPASIAGIFAAKGRPSDNPLIVHVSSTDHLERCLGGNEKGSAIPQIYRDLVNEFWPGPLTILIPVPEEGKGVKFAANVHPGQKTIGFRVPSSLHARFLMAVTDRPIAAPSANSSGKPSPTTAKHVKDDLDGKISFILDGGSCDVGVESTVVDGLGETPLILRPGGVSKTALQNWGRRHGNIWQHVENGWEMKKTGVKRKRSDLTQSNGDSEHASTKKMSKTNGTTNGHVNGAIDRDMEQNEEYEDSESTAAPRAPGMKYKHYAPKARLFLFESSTSSASEPNMTPVYNKLKELLDARDTTPNDTTSHLVKDPNNSNAKSEWIEGPTHTLVIGILPSTSWPHRAKIDKVLQNGLHPDWIRQDDGSVDVHSVHDMNITDQIPIEREDGYTEKELRLEVIELGEDSATISRNLFAALRTCDDVGCDWIFAEAPSRSAIKNASNGAGDGGSEDLEDFETVLERLRKAATEIIQT